MKTKYDVGDHVTVSGTIVRTEILPENRILYYMDEAPGVPIQEKDICKDDAMSSAPTRYVTVSLDAEKTVSDMLNEYVELLKKARSLAQDLAEAEINLKFCLDHNGKRSPTVLASVFTDPCDD